MECENLTVILIGIIILETAIIFGKYVNDLASKGKFFPFFKTFVALFILALFLIIATVFMLIVFGNMNLEGPIRIEILIAIASGIVSGLFVYLIDHWIQILELLEKEKQNS
jgi:hypothetical protein